MKQKHPTYQPLLPFLAPSIFLSLWNFTRILDHGGTVYQGIMELSHLWVILLDCWHLRPPLQQLQPEILRTKGTVVHLCLVFRIIIVAQNKLFVESLFLQLSFFCFAVQKKRIRDLANCLVLSRAGGWPMAVLMGFFIFNTHLRICSLMREREKHLSVASAQTRDGTCNLDMCPD